MDLTRAVSAAIRPMSRNGVRLASPAPRPVFQLTAVPQAVDTHLYANAKSPSTPGGDLLPLRAFRDMVDPVPTFTRWYTNGPMGTESLWNNIIDGAAVVNQNNFSLQALNRAQQLFAQCRLPSLEGLPGNEWRPVYAQPYDWYAISHLDQFRPVTINMMADAEGDAPFAYVGSEEPSWSSLSTWRVLAADGTSKQEIKLDPKTRLKAIRFLALEVTLQRPWLDFSILRMAGISLPGQDEGFISSGQIDTNDGVLPLLPTNFILAQNLSIEAEWADSDRDLLNETTRTLKGEGIALGSFLLQAPQVECSGVVRMERDEANSSAIQIVSWISALIPKFPSSPRRAH